ncbi:AMP-binding protein [Methylosinus sp. Ce-a6]|uniref:AMP-binding protein n=1 Tax=Methylosinus sp. Ce-a6 TaxID=2172005 RepID=UPI0013590D7D|nr:AMP-binding protein [Methylosinus sp. Ce-a6]
MHAVSNYPGRRRASQEAARREVFAVVDSLAREMHPRRSAPAEISLSSRLEQDLGVDSLARAELNMRLERAFHAPLPLEELGRADTVGDLLNVLEKAPGAEPPSFVEPAPAEALPHIRAAFEAQTLTEALDWHAARNPERLHLTFLRDAATPGGALTYWRLADEARRAAEGLVARDVALGDRIALMLPTGLDFFIGFFGILYAGAIPVPIYPPMRMSQIEEHLTRQIGILRNAGVKMLVTAPEGLRLAGLARGRVETLEEIVAVVDLTAGATGAPLPPTRDAGATAMLQYTSGSTGDPKGVVLSHANLLANIRAMGLAIGASSADTFVSWLPLYHDMGLIGAWLGCLHFGAPLFVMSPLTFLSRPASWLEAIDRHRATLSAAPNFAFELCLDKIDATLIEGLDLGSLRMVANGAEPVSPRTIRRFAEKFAKYGFRAEAMAPVYGLAENSVGLAFPPPGRAPAIDRIDRDMLSTEGRAEPTADDSRALELVSCGAPLPGHEIRIVDASGRELGERREGRLEFRGPSATSGYFRNEEKTRALIRDGWLDSGDRAYMAAGEIYVTGRVKDIVIRAGRHLYPQEIEEAVAGVAGIRKGCVAAFGAPDTETGTERLIVVAETYETVPEARGALETRVQAMVSAVCGAPAEAVVFVPPRSTPKTSSGKIRRSAAKTLFEQGRLGESRGPVWTQIARLALSGLWPSTRRAARRAADLLYAGWWWLVVCAGYFAAWVAVMMLPRRAARWAAVQKIAATMLRAFGADVGTEGLALLPEGGAVLAFNHSSYVDVMLLAASLRGEPAFVAKKELAGQLFVAPFLRRLGALFVERFEIAASVADAEKLTAAAQEGRNLVFFPEGTFTRRAGLSGFYLGAFKVAAEAGLPVYPGVLRGTRSMLRGGQWFPRRAALSLTILPPSRAGGTDFTCALRLRDHVRAAILAQCGEPDLSELTKPNRGNGA